MPYTTQTSDFWGWYLRHNNRIVWKHLQDAGIDLFSSGPSNNPQAFLNLTNVLPAVSGGFNRRWGTNNYNSNTTGVTVTKPVRTFIYNAPQDASDTTNTANTNLWLTTDNQNFDVYKDNGLLSTGYTPTNFATTGNVGAVTSREFFYYGNGVNPARKIQLNYTGANTDSLVGIAIPQTTAVPSLPWAAYPSAQTPGNGATSTDPAGNTYCNGTGLGYLTLPSISISDPVGSGSGATITALLGPNGELYSPSVTSGGSNYQGAVITVDSPPSGGTQAYFVVYVQTNSTAPNFGEVVGVDIAGPMQFIAGRQYFVALQNSTTGHTSDIYQLAYPALGPKSGVTLNTLTSSYSAAELVTGTTIPVYLTSTLCNGLVVQAGFTQLEVQIIIPGTAATVVALDSQVDTVILLAASDGGSIGTLYQVALIPLSSFASTGGYYYYRYVDSIPDSISEMYIGTTLLPSNLWAYTDPSGNSYGILLNEPPTAAGFLYPTLHQGRLFATDGKSLFFSKSLDEVTTSTGLITSKWEECWPGDYNLPIALNNETILGIKSDGTNLHVGTDKSIFTVYGSDPTNFSVPSVAFAQTGILSNDCWSVIYAEGMPSGFVWITQDFKVMHSDFSTYREIGTEIYPVLQTLNPTYLANAKVLSLTQGPYNFVFLQFVSTGSSNPQPEFWIWESRLQKWYHWIFQAAEVNSTNVVPSAFIYQYPSYTSADVTPGSKYLFYWLYSTTSTDTLWSRIFDPDQTSDLSTYNIPWSVRTSWQDCGDATAIKTINEIEVTGDDGPFTVGLYGATAQSQFDSGGTLLKSATTVTGPISSLATNKFFCAGANTTAKYYSISLSSASPGTSAAVLSSFTLEFYPMARI